MWLKSYLFVFISVLSLSAYSIEESRVLGQFTSELLPYVLNNYKRGSFSGVDQVKINYYFLEKSNPDGVLIISPGQSESSLKYSEFLYDLKDLNYSIYIIDHRGQGESGRLLPDPIKSHVNRFSDYVNDFSYFVTEIVNPQRYRKSILLAHSMGGTIVSGFLLSHPKPVTAVILLAPMLEVNTGEYFDNLGADIVANILSITGFSTNYAPTQKPYNPAAKFETNSVTSSRARFQMRIDLYNKYPQLRVGGTTVNWLRESLEYAVKLRTTPNVYQVPTVVFQAGKDQFVWPRGQNQTCELLSPKVCKIIRSGYENSQHEILMEQDFIRNKAVSSIKSYIKYFKTH